MVEGGGSSSDRVRGWASCRGFHTDGSGTDLKGGNDYRGIGLVEVMWKEVAAILNRRLTDSITFHKFLHIFRAGCGTGTTTLEAKLLQQLVALRE